jgi:hypothetical protein
MATVLLRATRLDALDLDTGKESYEDLALEARRHLMKH